MQLQTRIFAALLALSAAAAPAGAFAQTTTAPTTTPDAPPSYARPSYGSADETIHGTVSAFDGAYALRVRDDRGFIDNVQLRPGTVINPTGLRLAPGMTVTIHGTNGGSTFAAAEIDTPYQTYGATFGAVPVDPYAYPVYPYAVYPVYPYPVYGYPYGPAFSLGIGIGPGFHHGYWR